MKIKETIERDCCERRDMIVIGKNDLNNDITQCKYCKTKFEVRWCGPGNNDYAWRLYNE